MKINGPIEIFYAVTALCAVMTVLLLTGKGSWMIAGYNTASEKEKAKYIVKRLCRVMGGCLGIITLLLLIVCFAWNVLPYWFTYVIISISLVDIVVTMILANTICRRR